jgi:hypothetical protein
MTETEEGAMAKGILVAMLDFSGIAEDEFHDWYDLEHVPERRRIAGFLGAERWLGIAEPKLSLATYDLESVGVLASAPYRAVAENPTPWTRRVTARSPLRLRYEGEQLRPGDALAPADAVAALLVAMNVAPEHEAELNEWYDVEHLPALAAVPGTLRARRSRGRGATQRYLALYHFDRPDVPSSAAWKTAANTAWTQRMRPHFRDFLRVEWRRYRRTDTG